MCRCDRRFLRREAPRPPAPLQGVASATLVCHSIRVRRVIVAKLRVRICKSDDCQDSFVVTILGVI